MASMRRSCGAEIRWAHTTKGKKIPLDAEPERRFIIERKGGVSEHDSVELAISRETYVSHFATCPDSDDWRKD